MSLQVWKKLEFTYPREMRKRSTENLMLVAIGSGGVRPVMPDPTEDVIPYVTTWVKEFEVWVAEFVKGVTGKKIIHLKYIFIITYYK